MRGELVQNIFEANIDAVSLEFLLPVATDLNFDVVEFLIGLDSNFDFLGVRFSEGVFLFEGFISFDPVTTGTVFFDDAEVGLLEVFSRPEIDGAETTLFSVQDPVGEIGDFLELSDGDEGNVVLKNSFIEQLVDGTLATDVARNFNGTDNAENVDLDQFSLNSRHSFSALAGDDTIVSNNRVEVLAGLGDDLVMATTGRADFNGGDGNDTLTGGSNVDTLNGGDGDDWLSGGAEDDSLDGGNGADFLEASSGRNRLTGGDGDDTVNGGTGMDTLSGGEGNDILNGAAGDDRIFGGNGSDDLFGGRGSDEILGDSGRDSLAGNGGADTLEGGGGRDQLEGGRGGDSLFGGGARDLLLGGGGADSLDGRAGRDRLDGGNGRDHLFGGTGNDELTGGRGADRFVFSIGNGRDFVTDFEHARDRIEISSGADSFADLRLVQVGDDVRLVFSNVRVTFENDEVEKFSASDFIF